jgi:hypothetical protein
MLSDQQVQIQKEIETKYGVKMYPLSSTFQMKILDFYSDKKKLSEKQVESIKNPKYPVKAY